MLFATASTSAVPRPGALRYRPASAASATANHEPAPEDPAHAGLVAGFRGSGGIARSTDLARLLEYLEQGDGSGLARCLAQGTVFGFPWRAALWIPMFQYQLRDLSVRPAAAIVLADLGGARNGWAVACWFAEPNGLLAGACPVALLNSDLAAVREAARADRFVRRG